MEEKKDIEIKKAKFAIKISTTVFVGIFIVLVIPLVSFIVFSINPVAWIIKSLNN